MKRRAFAVMDDPADRRQRALDIAAVLNLKRDTAKTILDIGTGSGGIAHGFGTFFPNAQVDSVDVSDQRMVTDGYRFHLYDGHKLPCDDNSVDVIVFNHVLEHVGDQPAQLSLLNEINRSLKPDGTLYLGVPNKWALVETHLGIPFLSWLPKSAANRLVRLLGKGDHFDVDSPSMPMLRSMLKRAGFQCQRKESSLLWARANRTTTNKKHLLRLQSLLLRAPLPFIPTIITVCKKDATQSCVFSTRKFPPSTGGMESYAKNVYDILDGPYTVDLVANGRTSLAHLSWFLPYSSIRLLNARRKGENFFLMGDPLTLAAARLVLPNDAFVLLFVHGLDMTFGNRLYQTILKWSVKRADRVLANSSATAAVAQNTGIDPSKILVIPPAVPQNTYTTPPQGRAALEARFDLKPHHTVCLTVGRLVERKGVAWFIKNVLPALPEHMVYLIAGDGDQSPVIAQLIADHGLEERVKLLGRVSEEDRILLMQESDLFVMPNIAVAGDMEGFGMVAAEASLAGTVVLASGIEGIKDAVIDHETGFLVASRDAESWATAIRKLDEQDLKSLGRDFQASAAFHFGPETTRQRLLLACHQPPNGEPVP